MRNYIVISLSLVMIMTGLALPLLNIGTSWVKPMGDWAEDRYEGGPAFLFSGNFTFGHFVLVAPDVGYAMLGEDKVLQKYLEEKAGYLPSEVEDIKSTMWWFGGGVKIRFSTNPIATPYVMGLFEFYRRGIGWGDVSIPEIENFDNVINTYGPCIGFGVEILPDKPVTAFAGFRWFYGKGVGTTEIEKKYLEWEEKDAHFLVFHAGVDFL
ncbi:MAG: hypothetical protein DRH51_04575 [Candidatus Coatesbacteria bacterium]|nr:MAG: hypothetical protein DRH51_04575 [Candidatus Coatesbacteria bacterium]RLC43964.1 MAG: hypothetical protein DRH44_03815 [Candidatus Coatesbacteria bacterium]